MNRLTANLRGSVSLPGLDRMTNLRRFFAHFLVALLALTGPPATSADDAPPAFELRDGDRVVLVGNTFVERMIEHNFLETLLTRRHPERHVIFRNLGWSGDNVRGRSRAGFDPPESGFPKLLDEVRRQQPTVVIVGYGMNESFRGDDGLEPFREGLTRLLDALAETGARLALVSPIRHQDLGRPLPDPAAHNRELARYVETIRSIAAERRLPFVDLFRHGHGGEAPLPTTNGIHLTGAGYRLAATSIARGLGIEPARWEVDLSLRGESRFRGTRVSSIAWGRRRASGDRPILRMVLADDVLPSPCGDEPRVLRVRGLRDGPYTLAIDGQPVATRSAAEWRAGVDITDGPQHEQLEALRREIATKNFVFFQRWRPHNTTYLFGFRRHEQGRNAREVAALDPIIAGHEERIAELRQPREHVWELRAVGEER